jgi:hypothetical protein
MSATLVVISYYDQRPIAPLKRLLRSLKTYDAGADHQIAVVVNRTRPGVPKLALRNSAIRVVVRENSGMNIGAWEAGWRAAPGFSDYLFLQDDCCAVRAGWLGAYRARGADQSIGLLGESLNSAWDKDWSTLARERAGEVQSEHLLNGAPGGRVAVYLDYMARHGIDPGETGRHLRSLVWYARRDVLETIGGFPIGSNYGECISAEIGVSRKVAALGLKIEQIATAPFHYFRHEDWVQAQPDGPYQHRKSRRGSMTRLPRRGSDRPEEKIASLNHALADRDKLIASLNQVVLKRNGQISSFNQTVANRDEQIANLNQVLLKRNEQIANFKQAEAKRDEKIANLNQVLLKRNEQIANFEQAEAKRDEKIANLNQVLLKRNEQIVNFKQAEAKRDEKIVNLNQIVARRGEQVASLSQTVTERDGEIAGLRQALAENTATLHKAEAAARQQLAVAGKDFAAREALLERKLNELRKELGWSEGALAEVHARVADIEQAHRNETDGLRGQLARSAEERQRLEFDLTRIRQSLSWRMTAPVRLCGRVALDLIHSIRRAKK